MLIDLSPTEIKAVLTVLELRLVYINPNGKVHPGLERAMAMHLPKGSLSYKAGVSAVVRATQKMHESLSVLKEEADERRRESRKHK